MTIQKCGMSDAVLETLAQCSDKEAGDIKASFQFIIIYLISTDFAHLGFSFSSSHLRY